jgi:hypothetical protein
VLAEESVQGSIRLTSHRVPVSVADAIVHECLSGFEAIHLDQLDDRALLDRTDTKYVFEIGKLTGLLETIRDHYSVLEIESRRLHHYQTTYFDTPDFALYRQHRAGRPFRYKIRSRQYVDSGETFLEIKRKAKRDRTVKNRLRTPALVTHMNSATSEFINLHAPTVPRPLVPKVLNSFARVTLFSRRLRERLTLDVDLSFSNDCGTVAVPGAVVAELKQEGYDRESPFVRTMKEMGIRSQPFSKYCIGVALLYDGVASNSFKPVLLKLERTVNGRRG